MAGTSTAALLPLPLTLPLTLPLPLPLTPTRTLTLTLTPIRHEHICPAAAPECRGYVMGSSWGTCAAVLGGGGGGGGAGACPNRHRVSPSATGPLQGLLRQLAWPLKR